MWTRKVFNEINFLKKYSFGNRGGRGGLERDNIFESTVIDYLKSQGIFLKMGIQKRLTIVMRHLRARHCINVDVILSDLQCHAMTKLCKHCNILCLKRGVSWLFHLRRIMSYIHQYHSQCCKSDITLVNSANI